MPGSSRRSGERSGLSAGQSNVERLVQQAQARQAETEAGRGGAGRPGHGGQVGQDKTGRTKATFDLPQERQDQIRQIAEAEDISLSDVVQVAVAAFHAAWSAGLVDLAELKTPARSLKFSWKLELPPEIDLFSGERQP